MSVRVRPFVIRRALGLFRCVDVTGHTLTNSTMLAGVGHWRNNATLVIPSGSLAVGDGYLFSVAVRKGARNGTASARIVISAGAPPMVSISALADAKYNPAPGAMSCALKDVA